MEALGVHHIAIKARDIRRTATFYAEVLGLKETHRNVDEVGLRSVWFECGNVIVMVERSAASGDAEPRPFTDDPPGLHLLALAIPNDGRGYWTQKLTSLGHAPVHETDFTVYVQDPEGNRIGLTTWPHASRTE